MIWGLNAAGVDKGTVGAGENLSEAFAARGQIGETGARRAGSRDEALGVEEVALAFFENEAATLALLCWSAARERRVGSGR